MAIKVTTQAQRREYILKADRDSTTPTVFVLRPLTRPEHLSAERMAPYTPKQALQINAIVADAVKEKRELTVEEIERMEAVAPTSGPEGEARLQRLRDQQEYIVTNGVVEIRNLLDGDGNPAAMTPGEFAQNVDDAILTELVGAIRGMSQLGGDAIKK